MDDLEFIRTLLEIGDRSGAIENLTRFARDNPQNIDGWFLLAQTLDDDSKKADCYRYIIRLDPENELAIERLKELSNAKEYENYQVTRQSVEREDLETQRKISTPNSIKAPASKKSPRRKKNIKFILLIPFGIIAICLSISITLFVYNSAMGLVASPGNVNPSSPSETPQPIPATWTITPRPSTSTPTSTSTKREPTQTATLIPTNTPDPLLHKESAKSYIPSMSELPGNFYIVQKSPIDFKFGDEFIISYANSDPNYFHTDDANGVLFDVIVCNDESTAELIMGNIAKEDSISYLWSQWISNTDETINPRSVNMVIPGVDSSKIFMANLSGWQVPGFAYFTIIRSKNVVVITFITTLDLGNSEAKAQSQALYFTSLVTQKLKQ